MKKQISTQHVSKVELALKIDSLIEDWLRLTGIPEAKPKDVMPMLVEKGIFAKDHRDGLPLRKLLRELDDSGHLEQMSTARVERRKTIGYGRFDCRGSSY